MKSFILLLLNKYIGTTCVRVISIRQSTRGLIYVVRKYNIYMYARARIILYLRTFFISYKQNVKSNQVLCDHVSTVLTFLFCYYYEYIAELGTELLHIQDIQKYYSLLYINYVIRNKI